MTTIFFGPLRAAQSARPDGARPDSVKPVASVCCSAIVVCHFADRRRVTKP
ncbi:hypothetical protein [Methylobacterium tarhaniae]|uniref:hypothetical protein n=1 Tax=Methylobacterium tarhaniae TaxID=1187852 RepID=UPI0012EED260|nr:hypothetical protein [Methylobacterium tarhaniae]